MKYSIDFNPSFSVLRVLLESSDDFVLADAGSMIYQSLGVKISSGFHGKIGSVLKRVFLAKEYAFLNKFYLSEEVDVGEIAFAPSFPGSILEVFIENSKVFARPGSFLALTGDLNITGKIANTGVFFTMSNLSFLSVEGSGVLFLSGFGSIVELDVNSDYTVDTGHVLAYTQGLDVKIRPVGNPKSFMFSKEGFVADFKGKGKVWVQTRNEKDYALFNQMCSELLKK